MAEQKAQPLPNKVAQVAEAHQLGSFSQAYWLATKKAQGMGGGCLSVLAFLPCIILGTLARYGISSIWLTILLVAAALLIILLGSILESTNAAYLFENGIVYSRNWQYTPLLWSQIASCEMHEDAKPGSPKGCIVTTKDGRTFPIGNLARYEDLGTIIENHIGL